MFFQPEEFVDTIMFGLTESLLDLNVEVENKIVDEEEENNKNYFD